MNNTNIKALVEELTTAISESDLDDDTRQLLRKFENDIEPVLTGQSVSDSNNSMMDTAMALEISFARQHPTAEGIVRQIITALGNIGI